MIAAGRFPETSVWTCSPEGVQEEIAIRPERREAAHAQLIRKRINDHFEWVTIGDSYGFIAPTPKLWESI